MRGKTGRIEKNDGTNTHRPFAFESKSLSISLKLQEEPNVLKLLQRLCTFCVIFEIFFNFKILPPKKSKKVFFVTLSTLKLDPFGRGHHLRLEHHTLWLQSKESKIHETLQF